MPLSLQITQFIYWKNVRIIISDVLNILYCSTTVNTSCGYYVALAWFNCKQFSIILFDKIAFLQWKILPFTNNIHAFIYWTWHWMLQELNDSVNFVQVLFKSWKWRADLFWMTYKWFTMSTLVFWYTSLVFKWSTSVRFSNGLELKWSNNSKTGQNFCISNDTASLDHFIHKKTEWNIIFFSMKWFRPVKPFYFQFDFWMVGTILFPDKNCVQKMAICIPDGPVFTWWLYILLYCQAQIFCILELAMLDVAFWSTFWQTSNFFFIQCLISFTEPTQLQPVSHRWGSRNSWQPWRH
jgi:hypothetical protein